MSACTQESRCWDCIVQKTNISLKGGWGVWDVVSFRIVDARLKTASVSIRQRRLFKHLGFSNLCVLQMFMEDNLTGYIPASDVLTLLGDFNA